MSQPSIHDACRQGKIDAVRAMIAADPAIVDADDEHGWRPIFHAALWRHEPVVRLLIESGADLAAHDSYVMHYAGEVPNNKPIGVLAVQEANRNHDVVDRDIMQKGCLYYRQPR